MEEASIGVIRLCSWPDSPLPDFSQFTAASLSPSLHRLLLVSHQSGNAKLLRLSGQCSAVAPTCQPGDAYQRLSSFAWACQRDSYGECGVCGPFEELLFTSGSGTVTIYGFAKRPEAVQASAGSSNWLHHLPAFEVDAELVASDGSLILHFPESECWPQVVAYNIPLGSPSFHRLLAFADPEAAAAQAGGWSLVKLFSNSLATVAMLLAQQCKPCAQVVLLLTVCGWELRWYARVRPDMEHRWVDLALLGDMLLGLTDTGLICYWSASTGRRLRVLDCGLGDPAAPIFAAGCSLIGITGKLGQLLLVPIDPDHVSHWETAGSEVWRHNWSSASLPGPSAFTPKRLLGPSPGTGRAPQQRQLLLPSCSARLAAAAVSSHAVTRLFKVAEKTVLVQSRLKVASPADAEFYVKDVEAVRFGEVLPISCQGFLYLVTESALDVVLPQEDPASERPWWLTTAAPGRWLDISGMAASESLRQSKLEVLDKALVYDGLEEAEQLSALNGWSLKFTRLRKLQLSLAYGRTDEIAQILNELVPVGAAEEGLPRVVFAAMELMLNKFGTDNELAQATRLLAVAARFTKQLMIGEGLVHCLMGLACFLEAIRNLQAHLQGRRNRPKSEKSEMEASDKTEKRKQNSKFIDLENSRDSDVSSANATSLALAEATTGEITPWKELSSETAREMLLRWDKEDVDLSGIVKDALRAGRVPLAVVQLHQRRARDGPSDSMDAFKEVRNAGKSIVYELLCKGKVPVALAALRRLGEDIPVVLYDLAFGTVRRSLRIYATRELRRYGQLDAASLRLMQIISKIESVYPGTKFWRSYNMKLKAAGRKEEVEEPLQLCCSSFKETFTVGCGEVDGVVLGSWSEIVGSEIEEESADAEASPSYWVGAAIWLQDWDQETTERVILEQSPPASEISWKSQLAYNLAHYASQSVLELFESIPESELQHSELQVSLDSTQLEEGSCAHAVDAVAVAVPDVKLLKAGLDTCTSWLREAIESGLARRRVFLKAEWTGTMELLSVLAKAGLVFSPPENGTGTSYALRQIVVHHCVENNYPCLLELYLDHHKTDFHKDAISLRLVVEGSPWATWLLLSHQRDCEYETAFANARAIFSSSGLDFPSLTDLAKHGNELLAMSILMYAPALPQRCIITGFNREPRESWHCAIGYLQGLRRYPTLWTTIKSFCYGKAPGDGVESAVPSYLLWRKSLFSSSSGDATLLDMLPKWLPRAIRRLIRLSTEGTGDEAFVDSVSWEATLNTKLQVELVSGTCETTSTIIERQLLQGRPLAAFSHLVAAREELGTSKETEKRIVDAVVPLALANFGNMVVTAACTCFLELCGIATTVMRTDVAALLRISERPSTEDLSRYFSELLSEENGRPGSATAALVLEHLEKATLEGDREGCGTWLRSGTGDGQQLRASQLRMSERWSLVTAFCRVHHLPPSTTYLSLLAADNDWVGFLAEAQAESCPIEVLLSVAREHFSDDRLRNHILIVLESLSSGQSTAANLFGDRGTPNDLFDLLAKTEHQKFPGKELLERARILRWPLLAVAASCFSDVTPLSCLSTWLEVTAASEASCLSFNHGASQFAASVGAAVDATNATMHMGNTLPSYVRCGAKRRRVRDASEDASVAPAVAAEEDAEVQQNHCLATEGQSGEARDDHESVARMVAALCEHQRFLPLLRAFELFLPSSPLLHFIRFLRAFSQMRLSEASAHLADFSSSLREEMHSKGGKTATSWISKAAVAGADAVLGACPSAYEKRCMLQLLAAADFGDGGSAAVRFRRMYWKIQLAEPSLHQDGLPLTDGSDLGDEALLTALEKSGQWEEARSWARQLDFGQQTGSRAVDHVTEMQAEAMVAEWKELLWDMPEQRAALWRHCQALFTKHAYPPLKAGLFLMRHAEDIEQNGSPSELHGILLLALQWLSGSITGSPPVYPVPFLRELETRVWLLAVESEVLLQTKQGGSNHSGLNIESSLGLLGSSGSPVDRTAAKIAVVDSHLKAYSSNEVRQLPNSDKEPVPKLRRRLLKRMAYKEQQATEKRSGDEEPAGWEEKVGEGEVERAILALVEVGQVPAARQLQQKLAPGRVPLELTLCETALGVAMLSTPMVKGSVGSSLVPPGVLKTLNGLNLLKDVSSASPLQVMEALTAACREGCGRGHCRRITAVAQVANFLGLPFHEAFQKQATELLQLLSLKGQDALAEAKLLVATHSINPASIARLLAESFLKGLLAAHRGGYMESSAKEEGPAPLLWRPSDFVQWGKLCPSEPELGHALMRLVISGHDMPHACEVELLILAHQFYESSACLDGMDVLVALAATRVESYLAEADFPALARLVTGVSNFQALRFVLDLLIENGQLELLLKKRATVDASSGKESSASLRGFRMAVLSALKHFNPHDVDAFGMVFSHFSMAHEMANLLESRGRKGLNHWYLGGSGEQAEQNEETLDTMRLFVEASEVYAGIDCGHRTRWCCAQASLLSLQLRMPEVAWLNLGETGARRLLVEQRRFGEALVVAEAYELNQPAEWVPVLWSQVLSPLHWTDHFLAEFTASLPLSPTTLMELARIYRSELSARTGFAASDFSKWLAGAPEIARSFRCVLRRVRDLRLRMQLATLASGFPDVLDSCARVLDKVPDTAGPLVLKRGHGGTYVPIM